MIHPGILRREKRNTEDTENPTEDTEKIAGHGSHRKKLETTGKGRGVRSISTGCIPGAPEPRFLGRDPGAPGITSGSNGSRLWRARAARATTSSVPSEKFRVLRDPLVSIEAEAHAMMTVWIIDE